MKRFALAILVIFCLTSVSFAKGTPEQAKAMVKKAAAFYKANGKDRAIAAYNDPKGQFRKDDLFIFMLDMKGNCLAHMVFTGRDLSRLKDSEGKLFVQEMIETAKKGSGWVDYRFSNPVMKTVEPKTSYIQRLDDNYFIGCGAYK